MINKSVGNIFGRHVGKSDFFHRNTSPQKTFSNEKKLTGGYLSLTVGDEIGFLGLEMNSHSSPSERWSHRFEFEDEDSGENYDEHGSLFGTALDISERQVHFLIHFVVL